MKSKGMLLIVIPFIFLFVVVGLVIFGWGLVSYFQGRQAKSWPTTPGQILVSQLRVDSGGDSETWKVTVRYRYVCDGREYEGNRIAFGYSGSGDEEEHRLIEEKLRAASSVIVRYQPDKPDNSVLAVGFNRHTFGLLVFGATWLVFFIGMAIMVTSDSRHTGQIAQQIQLVE